MKPETGSNYGSVFINIPKHYRVFPWLTGFLVLLLLVFMTRVQFSEKIVVSGLLDSTRGVVRVYPVNNGVIVKIFVKQGDQVQKGQPLFLIDSSFGREALEATVSAQFEKRKKTMEAEIRYKKNELKRLQPLLSRNYISQAAWHRVEEAEAGLENALTTLEMERLQYLKVQAYTLYSPIQGQIAAMHYNVGQFTVLGKPLLKILPADAQLEAEILVPVNKAGFISKNAVLLHYDAYPYAQFGSYKAMIYSVSQSPSVDEEEDAAIKIGQPWYKVKARLEKQSVNFYGKAKRLQQGMTFTAVILSRKRTLAQWIAEPLLRLKGGVLL